MKSHILHIISALMAICLAACTDDVTIPGDNGDDGGIMTYTLQLAIADTPAASRSITSVEVSGLKTYWCYGDKVILKSSAGVSYEFKIPTTSSHKKGDRVETNVATFTYSGAAIPGFTSFTGTLTYDSGISMTESHRNGATITALQTSNSQTPQLDLTCSYYSWQKVNNTTDHLKCLNLSAEINNMNLAGDNVISLTRNYSIVKIIIDDFYYPVYGGSLLLIKGLRPEGGESNNFGMVGMILGENIFDNNASGKYTTAQYTGTTSLDPKKDKGIVPFCDVSDTKQPFSGYAQRDGNHKIVAYMVIFGNREVRNGETITVALREQWGLDWYFWESEPLKPFKLPVGSLYTIDFTQKHGGKYTYQSLAAIHLDPRFTNTLGYLASRQLGAEKVTDKGEYYMFGHDKPVFLGGHYQNYPDKTPYYYKEVNNKPAIAYNGIRTGGGSATADTWWYFSNPATYAEGTYIGKTASHSIKLYLPDALHPQDWWKLWVPAVPKLPAISMTWEIPGNMNNVNFVKDTFSATTLIGEDGQPTTDRTNPVGMQIKNRRTGHAVYLPMTGVLEASEKNNLKQIENDAVAQIKDGTQLRAVLPCYCSYLPAQTAEQAKAVQMVVYDLKIGDTTIEFGRSYYDLDVAIPIRPILKESINDIQMQILPLIP